MVNLRARLSVGLGFAGLSGCGNPDALGGGAAEGNVAGGGGKRERLIVVALKQPQPGAGANTARFKKFEKLAVALVNPADGVGRSGSGVGQKDQAAMAAAGGAFHLAEIAVRTDAAPAQPGEQPGVKVRGDSVLQPLGLVVNFPPFQAKHFR